MHSTSILFCASRLIACHKGCGVCTRELLSRVCLVQAQQRNQVRHSPVRCRQKVKKRLAAAVMMTWMEMKQVQVRCASLCLHHDCIHSHSTQHRYQVDSAGLSQMLCDSCMVSLASWIRCPRCHRGELMQMLQFVEAFVNALQMAAHQQNTIDKSITGDSHSNAMRLIYC